FGSCLDRSIHNDVLAPSGDRKREHVGVLKHLRKSRNVAEPDVLTRSRGRNKLKVISHLSVREIKDSESVRLKLRINELVSVNPIEPWKRDPCVISNGHSAIDAQELEHSWRNRSSDRRYAIRKWIGSCSGRCEGHKRSHE